LFISLFLSSTILLIFPISLIVVMNCLGKDLKFKRFLKISLFKE
jgi:hypothetical protein